MPVLNKDIGMQKYLLLSLLAALTGLFQSCSTASGGAGTYGSPNMGGPPPELRAAEIASEPTGNFYYGRRYFVQKTRFWGYLRKPRESAQTAKLVVFNESKKRNPDRLPEQGPANARYGFDQNYEYKIYGHFTGDKVYEINSNQILPEFMLTGYELVDRNPGWLFGPRDHYNSKFINLRPSL